MFYSLPLGTSLMAQMVKKKKKKKKNSANLAEDPSSSPGSGRSPGEGNGNLLQYSCLENSMDRRGWKAIIRGVTESDTAE